MISGPIPSPYATVIGVLVGMGNIYDNRSPKSGARIRNYPDVAGFFTSLLLYGRRQESSHARIVEHRADKATDQRADDRHPENVRAISQAVVLEAGYSGEEPRAEIPRRIDRETVQAAKSHADHYHDGADQHRHQVGPRRLVALVRNREDHEQQQCSPDNLIEQSGG